MFKKCIHVQLAALLIAILFPLAAGAQQSAERWYGAGVHQYFGGLYNEALNSFNASITENPKDPRAYYFRGLTQLAMGNSDAAQMDFRQGAFVEVQSGRRSRTVNRALERIQGHVRLTIEHTRSGVQLASQNNRQRARALAAQPTADRPQPSPGRLSESPLASDAIPGQEQPVQPLVDSVRTETIQPLGATEPAPSTQPAADPVGDQGGGQLSPAESVLDQPPDNSVQAPQPAGDSQPTEPEIVSGQRDPADVRGGKVFQGLFGAFTKTARKRVDQMAESAGNAAWSLAPTPGAAGDQLPPGFDQPPGFDEPPAEGDLFDMPADDDMPQPDESQNPDEPVDNPFADAIDEPPAEQQSDDDSAESTDDQPSQDPFGDGLNY